jgi:LacI family transcriptional regulator
LVRSGFTRIAFLGGTDETYINAMRYAGYRKALEKAGLPPDARVIFFGGYSQEAGEKMMAALLEHDPETRAVVCVNNLVFIGAMKAVQKHEVETGRSIMMAAFDINPYCEIFKRPLLCASQNQERLAVEAVSLLIDGIRHTPRPDKQVVVPVRVGRYRLG